MRRARRPPASLTPDEARAFLVGHHGLRAIRHPRGALGVRALLRERRCVQLDPLDPLGTNADLVALARVDGIARGDVYRHVYPGHAFEHFAKERCLLPSSAFPYYRGRSTETPWWKLGERHRRLPRGLLKEVLAEVRARGPLSATSLRDRGRVEPLDWNGWKGTGSAAHMALEVLWTRCDLVVCGRERGQRVYDLPERALPEVTRLPAIEDAAAFERWALVDRVEAAGLLSTTAGAHWSILSHVRTGALPRRLIEEGLIEEVAVEGSPRTYLAPAGFRTRRFARPDGRMRILAPLDPLLWDRKLVAHAFDFDYVWEVYKPAALRKWGWYVCPLLVGDRLVGRIDAAIAEDALRVRKVWRETGARFDEAALETALARHAQACGVDRVVFADRKRGRA
jgi:uncharacterized protein YcaQ